MFVLTIMVSMAIIVAVVLAWSRSLSIWLNVSGLKPRRMPLRWREYTAGSQPRRELAAANGAMLLGWAKHGRSVTVTVAAGDATAIARATDEP